MRSVVARLAGMRKEQKFLVYPKDPISPEMVQVQSERAIGRFHRDTGVGVLNWRGSNTKYGAHLSVDLGAEPYVFPTDFVRQCVAAIPKSGDQIAHGVWIA